MAQNSSIEWTQASWTPVRARVKADAGAIAEAKGFTSLIQIATRMAGRVGPHCESVSPGCKNCYSETNNSRCLPVNGTGLPFDRRSRDLVDILLDEKLLLQPLKWKRALNIFVCSQTDLFAEFVPEEFIDSIFAVMALCPWHTFQVLTKRGDRLLAYIAARDDSMEIYRLTNCIAVATGRKGRIGESTAFPLSNVQLGFSAENQEWFDKRWEFVRPLAEAGWLAWCSAEPLLGAIDATKALAQGLRWIVAGGESGRGARPAHPDWFRSLRDQCVAAGVPYFFKQWGEWTPGENVEKTTGWAKTATWFFDQWVYGEESLRDEDEIDGRDEGDVYRVGKKAAGRLLDGRTWDEMPVVQS